MHLSALDWIIVAAFLVGLATTALAMNRYARTVSGFLAADPLPALPRHFYIKTPPLMSCCVLALEPPAESMMTAPAPVSVQR